MDQDAVEAKLKIFFSPGTVVNKGKNHKERSPKQYWDDLSYLCQIYPESKSLIVEFRHIEAFDRDVSNYLLTEPESWLEAARNAIADLQLPFRSLPDITVRVIGLPKAEEVNISKLRDIHIERFLSIRCVASKCSEVRPAYEKAAYQCQYCGHETIVEQSKDTDALIEPWGGCENKTCQKKNGLKVIKQGSEFYNHQYLKVQEPVENLRGKLPEFLNISCADDIAGVVGPGDKLIITGVLKGKPKSFKDGKSKHIDFIFVANSIEKSGADYENIEIRPEDIEYYNDLAERGLLKQMILDSIAPTLYGMEDVKLGVALQLFGGVAVEFDDGTRKRGDIHIILVGDPGVAKSQLLARVAKISPRAVEFSGRSTSEAGLTGAAVKDDLDGKWWLQPGALTLADGGICCADEIDKMKPGQLGSIHEALEQQMVHINKVIKADMFTRTAFLGAANPKFGRYDKFAPLAEQIDHGAAFLSRMDLTFVMQDLPNRANDERLARHILSTLRKKKEVVQAPMETEVLRKCIAYARTHIKPELDDESEELIIKFFVSTRDAAGGRTDTVPITARTLEAAFRLATAHARMRLSKKITEEDARAAVHLLECNLRAVGIDPETGELDANVIAVGTSMSQVKKMKSVMEIIASLSNRDLARNHSARKSDVITECENRGIRDPDGLLKKLKTKGDIFAPEEGYLKLAEKMGVPE